MQRQRLYAEVEEEGNSNARLDRKLITFFCDLTVRGLPADGICDYLGISPEYYYRWLRVGNQLLEEGNIKRIEAIFVRRYRKALAIYRLDRVDRLHDPVNRNWYKELAILERRDRKTYGRKEQPGGSEDTFDPDERFL